MTRQDFLMGSMRDYTKLTKNKPTPPAQPSQAMTFDAAKNAVQLAEFAATALMAAEQLGIKNKPLENFTLSPAQRKVLLSIPDISKSIKNKLTKDNAVFIVANVASMTMSLAEASIDDDPRRQIAILLVAKHLTERLHQGIDGLGEAELQRSGRQKAKTSPKTVPSTVYQFKIILLGSKPPIWRRIQVEDCTLDKLHEHIQTAMGWTNSHLHRFEIFEKRYADPELFDDDFNGFKCIDSTKTKISAITPNAGDRFSFTYEYDMGDGWEHEILFEGSPKKEPGKKYPMCLEGARACPPEDVGGIGGFYEFLKALADPKHPQHADFIDWGGDFDPKGFDAEVATKAIKKGLPDWRM